MSSTPVRSIARAIDLLRALNRQPVSTVEALYAQTGIPKPTIVRMLRTFESQDLVRHAPKHGAYMLSSGVQSLASGFHGEPLIVQAAAPLLDALTLRIKWPVAVAILDEHAMIVRHSTIPLSPLALRHSTISMRLSLVTRALGRVYLAFCTPEQQQALLLALTASEAPEDQMARSPALVQRCLEEVRAAGYALRDPTVWPASNTLAVPVFDRHGVAASIGLTFFSSTMKPQQAVERHLGDLQETARRISQRLDTLQPA